MSHYETLGVDKNATEKEIKKAYRAQAQVKHPDKGGTAEEFAPLANAYETLMDPERRLLYDATGKDQRPPIETEVQAIMVQWFHAAIEQDIPIIEYAQSQIQHGIQTIAQQRRELQAKRKKLEKRRKKIQSTAQINLAHQIIDGEIKRIDAALAHEVHQEEIRKALETAIAEYSEEVEKPKVTTSAFRMMAPERPTRKHTFEEIFGFPEY